MRPLRLTMTAFGPYAGTETVDFDSLTELGLFVVAGNNGSGKTTIFDALHYCLYGTLPGRRASYTRLRSDHAAANVECRVELDFMAAGQHWRVERFPKQTRAKLRGEGQIEIARRASLFRLDQGQPIAVANKIDEVDSRCRELVGLTGTQFERVALLPQGEFSRLLLESSTKRRELLRALFSSEIFSDATTLLAEQAAKATASDDAQTHQLEQQLSAIANALEQMTGEPVSAATIDIRTTVEAHRAGPVAALEGTSAELSSRQTSAARAHQLAIQAAERISRRKSVEQQFAEHQRRSEQFERDVVRLRDARAAIPVVNVSGVATQQRARLDKLSAVTSRTRDRARDSLRSCQIELPANDDPERLKELRHQLALRSSELIKRRDTRTQLLAADEAIAKLITSESRAAKRVETLQEERNTADERCRKIESERQRLTDAPSRDQCQSTWQTLNAQLQQRQELADLDHQHLELELEVASLETKIAGLRVAQNEAQAAQAARLEFHERRKAAAGVLDELERKHRVAAEFGDASARLSAVRLEHAAARSRADELWDSYIRGTATRVAEALVDDEPCPVCGSHEHPSPARASTIDEITSQAQLDQAREIAETQNHRQLEIESHIEALKATDPAIAGFDLDELGSQIADAKSVAAHERDRGEANDLVASALSDVATEVTRTKLAQVGLGDRQQHNDERRNQLIGALDKAAAEPVEDIAARVQAAAEALSRSESAHQHLVELHAEKQAIDQTIETVTLAHLEAEGRLSSVVDQLTKQQQQRSELSTKLAELTNDLSAGDQVHDEDAQILAASAGVDQLSELQTMVASLSEAALASQRAEALLSERLGQSPFDSEEHAQAAFVEPDVIEMLETTTNDYSATTDRLSGQLHELAGLPEHAPDVDAAGRASAEAQRAYDEVNRELIGRLGDLDRFEVELTVISAKQDQLVEADAQTRRLERVAALVKGDNPRNTSLENWVLGAHLRDVVDLANVRLARSTQQRFQLCVLDNGENRRGTWGLDLGIEDTVTGTRRPAAGLSGGELFQASLALALGLADVVMAESAGVRIDALFIDEGFGSLDESSVERAIDLLDELRGQGAMVGVITHVPALLDALPRGVTVEATPDGGGSTIRQRPITTRQHQLVE